MCALTPLVAMQNYLNTTQQLFQCREKDDDESRENERQLVDMETQMWNALLESEHVTSLRIWWNTYKDFNVIDAQTEYKKVIELLLQMKREHVSEQQFVLQLPKIVALSHYYVLYVDRDMLIDDLIEDRHQRM